MRGEDCSPGLEDGFFTKKGEERHPSIHNRSRPGQEATHEAAKATHEADSVPA